MKEKKKILFLVYTLLEADIARLTAKQIHKRTECETYAFHLRFNEFSNRFPEMIKKMNDSNLISINADNFPRFSPVKIIKSINPDLVVTIDDIDPIYHCYLIASKYLKISTLLIQPGIIGEQPFNWKNFKLLMYVPSRLNRIIKDYQNLWIPLTEMNMNFTKKIKYILKDLYSRFFKGTSAWGHGDCTKIAVSGDFLKNILIKQGISQDIIEVTGQPRFDSIYDKSILRDNCINKIKIDKKNKKTILYLPDASYQHLFTSEKTYFDMTRYTIYSCKKIPDTNLIIKPHPDENPNLYRSLVNEVGSDAIVYEGSDLHNLIKLSDLVITGTSTTGLETLILNKPLVIVSQDFGSSYLSSNNEYIPFIKEGVALKIQKNEEFPLIINNIFYDKELMKKLEKNREKFVYNHTYLQDGNASVRVADLITNMVNK